MARKKILFVSYYYPPAAGQALPGTQRSVKFIRYMNRLDKFVLTVKPEFYPPYYELDHPVSVPVNDEQVIRTDAHDIFQFLVKCKNFLLFQRDSEKAMVTEEQDTSEPVPSDITSGKGSFQKLKDLVSSMLTYPDEANCWIFSAVKRGKKLIAEEDIDFIFATGKPWSALIAAYFLKKQKEHLIIDFRDPWVNNPFEVHLSGIRKKIDTFLEQRVVRKADTVMLNTEDLRKEFTIRYPKERPEKFVTVTNGFDAADFAINTNKQVTAQHHADKSDALIITHAGLLYGLRDPISVFKALELYYSQLDKSSTEGIVFRQLGDIILDYDPIRYVPKDSDRDFFENLGQVSYDECLANLSRSDILLIIQPDTKTQIPSKLFEYIFLEKPILTIAPLDGALAAMILKYDFGSIYDPSDIEGIYQYLVNAVAEKMERGVLHHSYANRDVFNVKNITARFEEMLLGDSLAHD
jgi:hypothetical protein